MAECKPHPYPATEELTNALRRIGDGNQDLKAESEARRAMWAADKAERKPRLTDDMISVAKVPQGSVR